MKKALLYLCLAVSSLFAADEPKAPHPDFVSGMKVLAEYLKKPDRDIDVYWAELRGLRTEGDMVIKHAGTGRWVSVDRYFGEVIQTLPDADLRMIEDVELARVKALIGKIDVRSKERRTLPVILAHRNFATREGLVFVASVAREYFRAGVYDLAWYLFDRLATEGEPDVDERIGYQLLAAAAARGAGLGKLSDRTLEEMILRPEMKWKQSQDRFRLKTGWSWSDLIFVGALPENLTTVELKKKIQAKMGMAGLSPEYVELLMMDAVDPRPRVYRLAQGLLSMVPAEVIDGVGMRKNSPEHWKASLSNLSAQGLPPDVRKIGSDEQIIGFSGGRLYSIDDERVMVRDLETGLKSQGPQLKKTLSEARAVMPARDARWLAQISEKDKRASLHRLKGDAFGEVEPSEFPRGAVMKNIAFSDAAETIAIDVEDTSAYQTILVYGQKGSDLELKFKSPVSAMISHVALSPKGTLLAAYFDRPEGRRSVPTLTVWNIADKKVIFREDLPAEFSRTTPVLAADDSGIALRWQGHLRAIEFATGKDLVKTKLAESERHPLIQFPQKDEVNWTEFTEDGAILSAPGSKWNGAMIPSITPDTQVFLRQRSVLYVNRNQLIAEAFTDSPWRAEEMNEFRKNRETRARLVD